MMARWLVGVLTGAAAAGAFAWAFGRDSDAPAARQRAVSSYVTFPARLRSLHQRVSVSGTARPGTQRKIALPCPGDGGVITSVDSGPGDPLDLGRPIAAVEGRRIVAVPGRFPYYRDLAKGDNGPDVRQLRAALAASGFAVATDGPVDAPLVGAVAAMHRAAGSWASRKRIDHCRLLTVPAGSLLQRLRSTKVGATTENAAVETATGRSVAELDVEGEAAGWLRAGARFHGTLVDDPETSVDGTVTRAVDDDGRRSVRVVLSRSLPGHKPQDVEGRVVPRATGPRGIVVPVAAVFAAAGGDSYVEVVKGTQLRRVPVKAVVSSGGWVRIRATGAARVHDGDLVIVGVR